MKVDSACKQQNDEQDAGHLFIVLIKHIGDGLNLVLGHGLLESRRDRHNQKRKAADPDDRGQQMKPVIDDWEERIEIGDDTLEGIHRG